MHPIHIAFTADKKFLPYVAVSLYSVLKNADPEDDLYVYVIGPDLGAEERARLESLRAVRPFHVRFVPVTPDCVAEYCPDGDVKWAPYFYRLLVPLLVPDIDRILFMDADLVVTGSLREFYYTDFAGAYAAGVEDVAAHRFHQPPVKTDYRFYLNAGVLLMDAKRWRDENVWERFRAVSRQYGKRLTFRDQDIINYAFWGNLKTVDMKWNFHADLYNRVRLCPDNLSLPERLCKPVVIHYSIPLKPWHAGGLSHPLGHVWRAYAASCPVPVQLPSFAAEAWWTLRRLARYVWIHPGFLFQPKFWRQVRLQGFLPTIN